MDSISDDSIRLAINLIRTAGRKPQYIEFLCALCQCNGKAVRKNQWRIARMLVEESPELLLKLALKPDGSVNVSGDARYFPALASTGGSMELVEWLETTATEKTASARFRALPRPFVDT